MIVVTGAAGFIGSCLIKTLNEARYYDVVAVDDFSRDDKLKNIEGKRIVEKVHRDDFFSWIDQNESLIQFVFHLGARTDTTEFNKEVFDRLNLNYSKKVWEKCVQYAIPLVYASSAATYGEGTKGYSDYTLPQELHPLNPYGESKNEFDKWALQQQEAPFFWAGLKFFNVYGPNEYHKGRMASVVFHAYHQIQRNGHLKLFQSHRSGIADGEQKRDFIYVKDVCSICLYLMEQRPPVNGLLNVGTGEAHSFNQLADAVFSALNKKTQIEYIPTPEDIRDKYQYYTQADIRKLRSIGYEKPFYLFHEAITEYVKKYLLPEKYY